MLCVTRCVEQGAADASGAAVGYAMEFKFPVTSRSLGVKLPHVIQP